MVSSPLDPRLRIRAVLFDLDGTLYRQTRLRSLMAIELLTLLVVRPIRGPRSLRVLRAYRKAQEALRTFTGGSGPIAAEQAAMAASSARVPAIEVERVVTEWMMTRPLKYLRWCRAAGLLELLDLLDARGVRSGVLSDYPAESKLQALGLAGRFKPVLCTADPEINALKPNPRGFLQACTLWRLTPAEVLVVGDRKDADATGAAAAGMPCVIIGRPVRGGRAVSDHMVLPSFESLRRALDDV